MKEFPQYIQEKLKINKDSKVSKGESYSFYNNDDEVKEGDTVLFACKCGEGNAVFVKCIITNITYSKFNGKLTNKIYNIGLKLDESNPLWTKDDNTIKEFVGNGVYGYKISTQLLKLED